MSVTTPCREGITSETLSAWGDDGLSETEAARLRAHIATCPACQERLATYRDISALVSAQRIPDAPPVDLAAIRAGSRRTGRAANATSSAPVAGRSRLPRTFWGGLGAAIAAALIIAAFSQVFARLSHPTPTATATPAGTSTPAATATPNRPALVWEQRTLPQGLSLTQNGVGFTISPANGQEAWACQVRSDGYISIWWSNDQSRTWGLLSELKPLTTPSAISACRFTLDSVNPQKLALGLEWGCGECNTLDDAVYISGDGGRNWSRIPGAKNVTALATIGSRTYALQYGVGSLFNNPALQLLVSSDGLRSWRAVGPSTSRIQYMSIWADPATGVLVLSDSDYPDTSANASHLWRTSGDGTGTAITLPNDFRAALGGWIPATGRWLICDTQLASSAPFPPIRCTDDLGKTFTNRPPLTLTVTCADCNKGGGSVTTQVDCIVGTLALDGSLLSACQPPATVTSGQPLTVDVYRLAPGATTWSLLGPAPIMEQSIGGITVTADMASRAGDVWYSTPDYMAVATLPA